MRRARPLGQWREWRRCDVNLPHASYVEAVGALRLAVRTLGRPCSNDREMRRLVERVALQHSQRVADNRLMVAPGSRKLDQRTHDG
jgi:hypothetical protein